ncbi:MAG TPA: transglutaminase domain-containing protein [Candidatus Limnocylindrales bacterium]|nr:transglutaminase domain-containing protein [Candidatus Limnocylindrales bacterium]
MPEITGIKRRFVFRVIWHVVTALTVASALLLLYSIAWEASTRRYLRGFSDAIVPATAPAEEKVESILSWMAHGPARLTDEPTGFAINRDPTDTLNYVALLRVCGTATNAFINLANSAGLATRRLLILDENRFAKHVTVEVLIGGRWIVVDPAYRTVLRADNGATLTRDELVNPEVFAAATRNIRGYDPAYSFERTAHIRVERLMGIGRPLRIILDGMFPGWEESTEVTLLAERKSLAFLAASVVLLLLFLLLRAAIRWYAETHLHVRTPRVREQVQRAAKAFLNIP